MSTLTISGKALGSRRPLFADWLIPFPPELRDEGGRTLRDLIGSVVRAEVRAFRERQEERQIFRAPGATGSASASSNRRLARTA